MITDSDFLNTKDGMSDEINLVTYRNSLKSESFGIPKQIHDQQDLSKENYIEEDYKI